MRGGVKVPASGPHNARIALVGEAPSYKEVKEGAPFVGPAGWQLDRMLVAAGLDRAELFITNIVDEEVPQGEAKDNAFFRRVKQGRKVMSVQPTKLYMDGILRVVGELKEVKPHVVVPLGNYALWGLTQKTGITSWRGSIMESTMIRGLKVVPTIHPAFYTQQGGYNSNKQVLGIWDFQRIAEEAKTRKISLPQYDIQINPSYDQIERAVERLLAAQFMVVDTEWYGPNQLAYIGFTDSPDWAIVIPATTQHAYRAYKQLLSSPVPKVIQNRPFDDLALHRQGIEILGEVDDTMNAWHACWGDVGEKGLDTICSVLTRQPYYKDQLKYVQRNDPQGQVYCGVDCVVEAGSWIKLRDEEFPMTGCRGGYEIAKRISPIFCEAGRVGVRADIGKMKEMAREYFEKADYIEGVLGQTLGKKINCRSPKQVAEVVYDMLGIQRATRTTKQDELMDIAASTKDESLQAILTAVIRVRQNRNIVSRYLRYDPNGEEGAVDKDGRIRTNWNLSGTRGGARLSATIFGRGEQRWFPSVPMQTIPEDARVCYVADPGTVFVGWDYEQAEARVVAIKTRDYDLLRDMQQGIDIHTKLAAMLPFGKTYDELVDMIAAALKAGQSKDSVPERFISKKCRHALNYVMGSGTFRKTVNREWLDTGIGMTEGISRQIRAAYLKLHPGLESWWQQVRGLAKHIPIVMETCLGRTHQFLGDITDDLIREMVSFEPQATVADLCSLGIADAYPKLKKLDPQAVFLAHMHDGGFLQVKEGCAEDAGQIIAEAMTRELWIDHEPLTIPVEIKVGVNWKEMEKMKVAA